MEKKELTNPELYTNRELSWLLFNKRVLSEARDRQLPLFERLKFLSITASNLDEFFMVRIGSLVDMLNAGYVKKDISGMSPKEQLAVLMEETHDLWRCSILLIAGCFCRSLGKTDYALSSITSSLHRSRHSL